MFVKGPRFSRQVGITPIMEAEQMRQLLDSIQVARRIKIPRKHGGGYRDVADLKGLRDRAAIAIMGYTFARVSAVVGLPLGDYRLEGKRGRLRLREKGNKEKLVWLHREAEEFLDAYLAAAGIEDTKAPLFQTLDKAHILSGEAISRRDMLRREAALQCGRAVGFVLQSHIPRHGHHSVSQQWRFPGGGTSHSDPRTTKLYDRRKDLATLGEIERRIAFE
jgi:site-specific recombinase XerD